MVLMVTKLYFSMQNCLGFLLFHMYRRSYFSLAVWIFYVYLCVFLCGSMVMAEAEESGMPFSGLF